MKFNDLGLIRPILDALEEQSYTSPTPIQEQAIPAVLAGRDVLGCARTGTGKTCAFAAPILQLLSSRSTQGHPIRSLILTPTRELAIQIQESFASYGKYLPLKAVVIFGGVGQAPQVEALNHGCDILVATPGRLADLYGQGLLKLDSVEIFVLDEADRMLDMGFIHDVKRVLNWLPQQKQTLLFSATMPPEITKLVNSLLHNPARITVDPVSSPVESIRQQIYQVDRSNKTRLLVHLLQTNDDSSILVFTRTKHGANRVARDLEMAGISAAAIHGNKSQTARQTALAGFKAGDIRVLVATDIAARGLDIQELAVVVNYNLPAVPETYVHRIGRTGRAGHGGLAISFCDSTELGLLKDIEKLIGKRLPQVTDHPFPMTGEEQIPLDKHGKPIDPEILEARQSAQQAKSRRRVEQSGERKKSLEQKQQNWEPQKITKQNIQKQKKPPRQEIAKSPCREENAPELDEAPLTADELATLMEERKRRGYRRPERKPISLLDELAPPPEDDFVPDYTATPRSWEGNHFMDATTRLLSLSRKSTQPSSRQSGGQQQSSQRNKSSGSHSQQSNRNQQDNRGKSVSSGHSRQDKGSSGQHSQNRTSGMDQQPSQRSAAAQSRKKSRTADRAQQTSASDAGQRLLPPRKKRRTDNRPPRDMRSPYAHQKDSTEQKSLMRPYYLSEHDE